MELGRRAGARLRRFSACHAVRAGGCILSEIRLHRAVPWLVVMAAVAGLVICASPLLALVRFGSGPVADVSIWPAQQEILVSHAGSVEVRANNVEDLYTVELHVGYRPSVIAVSDALPDAGNPGIQVTPGNIFEGLPWHVNLNEVDAVAGRANLIFGVDRAMSASGISGSGTLARIDFRGLVPGTSPITFIEALLVHRNGDALLCTFTGGVVYVVLIPSTSTRTPVAWVSPTATNTPVPRYTTSPGEPTPTPTAAGATATAVSPTPRTTPVVFIVPGTQDVLVGHPGAFDIAVTDVPDLYGVYVRVRYCPGLLEIIDQDLSSGVQVEPGDIFAYRHWYLLANSASGGIIEYSAKLSFEAPAGATGGRVARVPFRASAPGTCPITILDAMLIDRQGNVIPVSVVNGLVNVVYRVPAQPTPTARPPAATPTARPTVMQTPMLYLQPDAVSMLVGQEAAIDVYVGNVTGLNAVEWHVQYDPAVVEVQDENPSRLGTQVGFGAFLSPDVVLQNTVDNTNGRIDCAIAQNPPNPPKSGTGIVARFRVRALTEGATSLAIRSSTLLSAGHTLIPHGAGGGLVTINTRVLAGRALLQGRSDHGGVQIQRGDQLLAITNSDGSYVLPCPEPVGGSLSLGFSFPGYLPAAMTLVAPPDMISSLGSHMLYAGDTTGTRTQVPLAAGCSGGPSIFMPGSGDDRVDILDIAFVASRLGMSVGDPGWAPTPDGCHPEWIGGRADLNGDARCDIGDLTLIGGNFDLSGPTIW